MGKMYQIIENVIVTVPKRKDTNNKICINFCIMGTFLVFLLTSVILEEARPTSKAVQAAINIVEDIRIADVNAEGFATLNIMFPLLFSRHYS